MQALEILATHVKPYMINKIAKKIIGSLATADKVSISWAVGSEGLRVIILKNNQDTEPNEGTVSYGDPTQADSKLLVIKDCSQLAPSPTT
jgi:hypothetical protein